MVSSDSPDDEESALVKPADHLEEDVEREPEVLQVRVYETGDVLVARVRQESIMITCHGSLLLSHVPKLTMTWTIRLFTYDG